MGLPDALRSDHARGRGCPAVGLGWLSLKREETIPLELAL